MNFIMNQILSMDGGLGTPNGSNMNPYGGKKGPLETKTTVLVFAIVLIIFGIAMAGMGIFGLVQSLSGNNVPTDEWPKFDAQQDGNTLYLTVSDVQIIDKVVYYWNNGFETEVPGEQTKHLMVTLEVPSGDNILNLKSIDINGKETVYQKSFTGTETGDTTKPVIELSIIGSKLNIVAKTTTQTGMAYVTYQWNSEQETRVDATTDKTMIETQIAIPKGKNTITITAVKENGVSQTETKTFDGVVKPTITVDQEGSKLKITLSHESGIQSAKIVFNDRNVVLTSDRFGEDKTTVEHSLNLKTGQQNTIYIEVTSCAGTVETFNGVAQG